MTQRQVSWSLPNAGTPREVGNVVKGHLMPTTHISVAGLIEHARSMSQVCTCAYDARKRGRLAKRNPNTTEATDHIIHRTIVDD